MAGSLRDTLAMVTRALGHPLLGPEDGFEFPSREALSALHKQVGVLSQQRGDVLTLLETGSFVGATALALLESLQALGIAGDQVICVDDWQVPTPLELACQQPQAAPQLLAQREGLQSGRVYETFQHHLKRHGGGGQLKAFRAPFLQAVGELPEAALDMIHLAPQLYPAELKPFLEAGQRLLRPGGILCGMGPSTLLAQLELDLPATDYHGFWGLRLTETGWVSLTLAELTPDELHWPQLLRGPGAWPEAHRHTLMDHLCRKNTTPPPEWPERNLPVEHFQDAESRHFLNDCRELTYSFATLYQDEYIRWLTHILGGWLTAHHPNLFAFDFIIRTMPKGGAVLEIGSYLGMSTAILGYLLDKYQRQEPFFTCDPWDFEGVEEKIGGYYDAASRRYRDYCPETFKRNMQTFLPDRLPHTVERYSGDFLQRWNTGQADVDVFGRSLQLGGPLSFAYIDGLHTYEAAKLDFEGVDRALLPGGLVFFDDSNLKDFPGVHRLVQEVQQNPAYELVSRLGNYLFRKRLP